MEMQMQVPVTVANQAAPTTSSRSKKCDANTTIMVEQPRLGHLTPHGPQRRVFALVPSDQKRKLVLSFCGKESISVPWCLPRRSHVHAGLTNVHVDGQCSR